MTRACIALSQANFTAAWSYHPLSFLIVGLSIGVAFFPMRTRKMWTNCTQGTRNLFLIFGVTTQFINLDNEDKEWILEFETFIRSRTFLNELIFMHNFL